MDTKGLLVAAFGAVASCVAVHLGLFAVWPGYEQALFAVSNDVRQFFGLPAAVMAHAHGGFGAAVNSATENIVTQSIDLLNG